MTLRAVATGSCPGDRVARLRRCLTICLGGLGLLLAVLLTGL
jgi:hypothetical protein